LHSSSSSSSSNKMTQRRFRLISLLLLLLNVPSPTIASMGTVENQCTNFTFPDGGGVRELCYWGGIVGPSPLVTELPNGTEVFSYTGGSSETYYFEGDLEGLITEIQWDEAVSKVDCNATATMGNTTMECSSCALCNDGTSVSADCTNLDQGKIMRFSLCGMLIVLGDA